jgi:hypothetical protein
MDPKYDDDSAVMGIFFMEMVILPLLLKILY